MTKEEFRQRVKQSLSDEEGTALFKELKEQMKELQELAKPFDPILAEHLQELERVGENTMKYLITFYK